MNDDVQYLTGHRVLDGIDLDADILSAHPLVTRREVSDPVNDGSLGKPAYVPEAKNKDGSPF